MSKDTDTYKLTVTFSRSMSADLDVLRPDPGPRRNATQRVALVQQLRKELQAAYDHDDVAIDGQFMIDTITIDDVEYAADTGKRTK